MISINLMSDCVSRDMITKYMELQNEYSDRIKVLQYLCSRNIVSTISKEKGEFLLENEQIKKYNLSNFECKVICFDFNKTTFDYLFDKKSNYIILSFNGTRLNLLKKGKHIISRPFYKLYNNLEARKELGLDEYEEISIEDIMDKQWQDAVDIVCEKILHHYALDQIIYHKHYGVIEYDSDGKLKILSDEQIIETEKFNLIYKKIDNMFLKKLDGCHVIEFPQNVVADSHHKWGLCHLHYIDKYYQYAAEAFEIILNSYSEKVEQSLLLKLLDNYNCYFKIYREKLVLAARVASLEHWHTRLLGSVDFTKKIIFDLFGQNKFEDWINEMANNGKTVSVLGKKYLAGQIFLRALSLYKVTIIFQTDQSQIVKLSDEQFEKCKLSDVIINANIHEKECATRDGVTPIHILELIEN